MGRLVLCTSDCWFRLVPKSHQGPFRLANPMSSCVNNGYMPFHALKSVCPIPIKQGIRNFASFWNKPSTTNPKVFYLTPDLWWQSNLFPQDKGPRSQDRSCVLPSRRNIAATVEQMSSSALVTWWDTDWGSFMAHKKAGQEHFTFPTSFSGQDHSNDGWVRRSCVKCFKGCLIFFHIEA